jgi:uncharacterized Tic20 family protein
MFKKLTDFTYKRSKKEALGFYLAYLFLLLIVAFLCTTVAVMIGNNPSFDQGVRIGTVVAIVFVLALSWLILKNKKLFNSFSYLVLMILAGILAYFGGGVIGLILPAYFTTKAPRP